MWLRGGQPRPHEGASDLQTLVTDLEVLLVLLECGGLNTGCQKIFMSKSSEPLNQVP